MSNWRFPHALLAMGPACLLISSLPAAAETICTYISQSAEHPVPLEQRESVRQMQARVLPELIEKGDKFAAAGRMTEAVDMYGKVFGGQTVNGYYTTDRCASSDVYQRAANKFRSVAKEVAAKLMQQDLYLEGPGPDLRTGALALFLNSNQYGFFIDHALEYAERELPERDVDYLLIGLVGNRLDQLEEVRKSGTGYEDTRYANDLTGLLDEELAAFTKLAGFDEKLAVHLAPLYPKITDHWLAEEAASFNKADKTDGMIQKGMLHDQATGALEAGIDRLTKHPQQVARLKARANTRGEALMKKGRENTPGEGLMLNNYYAYARDYLEIADNQEQYAIADRLAEERQESAAKKMEASIRTDIEKMQKSDEEQSAFQDETDEMAAEFGFDLDE